MTIPITTYSIPKISEFGMQQKQLYTVLFTNSGNSTITPGPISGTSPGNFKLLLLVPCK